MDTKLQLQDERMADKLSMPPLLAAPDLPQSTFRPQNSPLPPSSTQSFPVLSLIQHILDTPPPSPHTAKSRPQLKEIQNKTNKKLVLESPVRPPPVIRDAQDEKGGLHSQLDSNTHVSFEGPPPQPAIQEGSSSGKGVQGSRDGAFGRQSWRKELSETGELLLDSILDQSGGLGKILDSAQIQEGDLLAILKGLCRFRQWKKALDVFEWMRNHEDHKPNAQTIALMIRTLCQEAQCSKATDLFHKLRLEGYSIDAYGTPL